MYAAKLNSIALIKLLLQYRADLFATDSVSYFNSAKSIISVGINRITQNQQTARTLATDKEVQKFLDKLVCCLTLRTQSMLLIFLQMRERRERERN